MSDTKNSKDSKSFWSTIPGLLTGCAAIITAVASLIGALAALNLFGGDPPAPPTAVPATVVVVTATPEPDRDILPTTLPTLAPPGEDVPEDWVPPVDNFPANNSCPYRADGIWLQLPGVEYGPFWDVNDGVAYSIAFDQQFIYIANSISGLMGTYDDPGTSNQRNQWVQLTNTPFTVCVDVNGLVFAAFVP